MKTNYETMQRSFGQKFRSLREVSGRTQAETAVLLKKPVLTYIKLEEDFLYPTESMLRKIAKLYNITHQELIAYGE